MLRNRAISVRLTKDEKKTAPTATAADDKSFEKKAEVIRQQLEGLGTKLFVGVCTYIILDTYRQVSIAKAMSPYDK